MKKQKRFITVDLADKYRDIYDSFLRKGFSVDQAFQLLLAVVKREKKS